MRALILCFFIINSWAAFAGAQEAVQDVHTSRLQTQPKQDQTQQKTDTPDMDMQDMDMSQPVPAWMP